MSQGRDMNERYAVSDYMLMDDQKCLCGIKPGTKIWSCLCFHSMSPGLSANIPEVAAMSDSAFLEDDEEEEDDDEEEEEEDEEIEKSLDFDSKSEDTEDEGPTTEAEDPATGYEGLDAGDEGLGIRVKSLGLGGNAAVPEGQQRAAPVMETAMGQSSRSVPEPKRPERVSALRQPTLTTWIDPEDASPTTAEAEGLLTELRAQVEMHRGLIYDHTIRLVELSPALFERYDRDIGELFTRSGAVRDEIFSQRYQLRSLEHE
ncbi:hypothetical protein Tco_0778909 [Tanacetum coccineum]